MPNASETRRIDASGTSKVEESQQIMDLFGFAGLHQLAPAIDPFFTRSGHRGAKSPYPATAMIAVVASARVTRSQASALKTMSRPEVWQACRENYHRRTGAWLPLRAPNRDQVQYFLERLRKNPVLLEALQQRFQQLAIGQARLLGNLLPGVPVDGANPNPSNSIYTDGTVIAKFSDVKVIQHPRTGEAILIGGRAKSVGTARIQDVVTDTAKDGKNAQGLNMVGVYTWTKAGRVVLATGKALGAEQWTVYDLIDSICTTIDSIDRGNGAAPGAIHTLINDRAVTGWGVDYLMGAWGIQVLSKAVGRKASTSASDVEINDPDLKGRVNRLAAEYGATPGGLQAQVLRRDVLADMLRYHEKLPVGLSIYPTQRHRFDLVRSEAIELEPAVHTTAAGRCAHPLVADDGALFLVEDDPEDGIQVKSRLLPCIRSDRFQRPDGRWATRNQYTVPCAAGYFTYERLWQPTGARFHPDSEKTDRAPEDRVGWRLRPLSRPDDLVEWYNDGIAIHRLSRRKFSDHFGRRNDAESYNQWYQQSLPHHGRAASLSMIGQEYDFLFAGLVNNSITWHNHKR
jgi:hypothetical protein